MLHAMILVCAVAAAVCDRATAIDVIETSIYSAMPSTCFMQGQAYLAGTQLGRDLPDGSVIRIACEHRR